MCKPAVASNITQIENLSLYKHQHPLLLLNSRPLLSFESMKTKRRAAPFPSQPEKMNPPSSLERNVTCSIMTTKLVEPQSLRKKARFESRIVRRSQRIRKTARQQQLMGDIERPVIQILDPSGSEKDDHGNSEELFREPERIQSQIQDLADNEREHEDDPSEENSSEPEPEQPIQENGKKTSTRFQNKSGMQYRTLYIESQKKLEELNQAIIELSKKLAVAEAKLEVFEKGSVILTSILDKTKDACMASALSRATEQALANAAPPRRKTSNAATKRKPVARPH